MRGITASAPIRRFEPPSRDDSSNQRVDPFGSPPPTIPTLHRCVNLMQDRLYRTTVGHQTMGCAYPPPLSHHFR